VLLFRQTFEPIQGVSIVAGYDVVTCARCGFAYADRIPSQEAFDQYYERLSKYEYHQRAGEESVFDRARMDLIADELSPLIPRKDSAIFDIGCATGRLLFALRERGFHDVTGLDPSPGCVAAAQRLYGIEVLQGSMNEFPHLRRKFDVVILVGVLEHIRDLESAVDRVQSVLSESGIVYVEVPDALEFTRWPNAPFQDFSVEHINFFSPTSIANLFCARGFETISATQNHRDQSYKTIMSNVSAAFRRTNHDTAGSIRFDDESRSALRRYVAQCEAEEDEVRARIGSLVDSGREFFVWGAGTNATRLLKTTRLSELRIAGFVDSNTKYHGKTLANRPIVSPEHLRGTNEPILIVSRVFQSEITRQIVDTLGLDREVLTLYGIE